MTTTEARPSLPEPRPAVQALADELIETRRYLHQHAELSNEEHETQRYIIERLRALGLEDVRPAAGTGATAIVRGSQSGPNLLWRADIDGLPIEEDTGLPFESQNKNVMHACGHDGHVAIALGMAAALQGSRDELAGTVRFAFQPAEERIGGARPMLDEGILDDPNVDRVFGLHIIADYPAGQVRVQPGPIFAAATHFRIIIRGRGGHASAPQETNDPIVVAAHAIVALQTVVSRAVTPSDTAVLTIGRIEGGKRGNIIPDSVMMSGSVRSYEPPVLDRVLSRMEEILAGVSAAWGAEYQFDHSTLPAVVNDAECAAIVQRAATDFLGAERVAEARMTGSDDMALFLEAAPGAYFLLGGGNAQRGITHPHHSAQFDFDEACLPVGVEVGLRVIEGATGTRAIS
ncbi:MAG: amidohydrolase [Dehalococcoidia bacterium]